nr:fumarylacetoacetate hydrolase family protein [Microbacterium sp. NIBRBAC000506063]
MRQRSNTAQLIFSAADLVAYISQFATLRAGDVVLTGTPGGVAMGQKDPDYLKPGDIVETSIDTIGTLRNRIVSTPAADGARAASD